jgi:hypothetical protein
MPNDSEININFPKFDIKFSDDEKDGAKLKLAFLKEHEYFRKLFRVIKRCPQFRKPGENDIEYLKRIRFLRQTSYSITEHCKLNSEFIIELQKRNLASTEEILNFIDPQQNVEDSNELVEMLPLLFYEKGISVIRYFPHPFEIDGMYPYERVLVIDLRKNITDLIRDIKHYIQHELKINEAANKYVRDEKKDKKEGKDKNAIKHRPSFQLFDWNFDKEKKREEAWKQLEVWQLRKKQMSFRDIAELQGQSISTTKERFYKAYQRIFGKPYDRKHFAKLAKSIKKNELPRTCDTCSDREKDCDGLCIDVEYYANQDHGARQESLLKEDSDAYIASVRSDIYVDEYQSYDDTLIWEQDDDE